MARIKRGIYGPIHGKLGGVVGSTWKGIPYLREVSKNSKAKKTRTPAQLNNEEKFKFINNWLVPFHPFLKVGFCLEAEGKTEIAAGLKANYKTVFSGTWPELSIDYAKLQLSSGSLPGLTEPELQYLESGELELSWKLDVSFGASYDDQPILAIYCPELQISDGFIGGLSRAAGKCLHQLDERIAGKALEVYVCVAALDRKQISDSIYLGRFSL